MSLSQKLGRKNPSLLEKKRNRILGLNPGGRGVAREF